LKAKVLRCPLCQQNFESVDGLPCNFWVLKKKEENKDEMVKRNIYCDNCENERLASVWCEHCGSGTYYCGVCDSGFHSGKATRMHIRLSIKEKSKKPNLSHCKIHLKDQDVYCLDCQVLNCAVCVIDDHPQHRAMSLPKYEEFMKNDLKKSLSSFDEALQYIDEKEFGIKEDIKQKEDELGELLEQVDRIRSDLNEKNIEEQTMIDRRKKVETNRDVLRNSIEETVVIQLMNKDFIEQMREKIMKIKLELFPERERLEKERIENLSSTFFVKRILPSILCCYVGQSEL